MMRRPPGSTRTATLLPYTTLFRSQPPLLKRHRDAFEAYAGDKAAGSAGYHRHWRVGLEAKALLARLTGLPAEDHALIGSTSEGIARALSAIPLAAGDNVVVSEIDYAAGRHAMLRLASLGVEPRVGKGRGWRIEARSGEHTSELLA